MVCLGLRSFVVGPSVRSFVRTFVRSLVRSFALWLVCFSFVRYYYSVFVRLLFCSFARVIVGSLRMRSCICPFARSSIDSFFPSLAWPFLRLPPFLQALVRSLLHSLVYSFLCSLACSVHCSLARLAVRMVFFFGIYVVFSAHGLSSLDMFRQHASCDSIFLVSMLFVIDL